MSRKNVPNLDLENVKKPESRRTQKKKKILTSQTARSPSKEEKNNNKDIPITSRVITTKPLFERKYFFYYDGKIVENSSIIKNAKISDIIDNLHFKENNHETDTSINGTILQILIDKFSNSKNELTPEQITKIIELFEIIQIHHDSFLTFDKKRQKRIMMNFKEQLQKSTENNETRRHNAAIQIQKIVRGNIARKQFRNIKAKQLLETKNKEINSKLIETSNELLRTTFQKQQENSIKNNLLQSSNDIILDQKNRDIIEHFDIDIVIKDPKKVIFDYIEIINRISYNDLFSNQNYKKTHNMILQFCNTIDINSKKLYKLFENKDDMQKNINSDDELCNTKSLFQLYIYVLCKEFNYEKINKDSINSTSIEPLLYTNIINTIYFELNIYENVKKIILEKNTEIDHYIEIITKEINDVFSNITSNSIYRIFRINYEFGKIQNYFQELVKRLNIKSIYYKNIENLKSKIDKLYETYNTNLKIKCNEIISFLIDKSKKYDESIKQIEEEKTKNEESKKNKLLQISNQILEKQSSIDKEQQKTQNEESKKNKLIEISTNILKNLLHNLNIEDITLEIPEDNDTEQQQQQKKTNAAITIQNAFRRFLERKQKKKLIEISKGLLNQSKTIEVNTRISNKLLIISIEVIKKQVQIENDIQREEKTKSKLVEISNQIIQNQIKKPKKRNEIQN